MSSLYLGGPSINPYWNVPLALHSLEGEIETARKIIELWEPLLNHRLAANEEHLHELGTATVAVMVTAVIAERGLKSLIAQTQPTVKPPTGRNGHKLDYLFGQLEPSLQLLATSKSGTHWDPRDQVLDGGLVSSLRALL